MTIDFAAELNPEQLAAAQAIDGPVLVIAAAGTGKTRTLIHRVAYMAHEGIDTGGVLLLTFTNKAAREMLDRSRDLMPPGTSWPTGGTFHSIGNRILRRHADLLGFPKGFTILDSDDSKRLMKNVYGDLGINSKEFPKPAVLLGAHSYAANTEADVREVLHDRYEHHPAEIGTMLQAIERYKKQKLETAGMDFDDLLLNTVRLFDEYPHVLEHYQGRYHHVMVDEYQDTNAIQARMVDLLVEPHKNIMVVGDDFQSIYAWRGADYTNIMEFPLRYEDTQVIKLVRNYRSNPEILEIANRAIANNPDQFQKELLPTRPSDHKPTYYTPFDGSQQARYVSQQIRLLRREGFKYKDIAVLYRTHFSSMEVDFELSRESIPFRITSGVRFFEQTHIKDVCAILQIIQTPTNRLAFTRLITLLPRVGDRTASKIWKNLGSSFNPLDPEQRMALLAALPKGAAEPWTPVDHLFERVQHEHWVETPSAIVSGFVDQFYDRYSLNNFDNYDRRMDNIRGLCMNIDQFESLEQFLNEMALQSGLDGDPAQDERPDDAVTLSTIHQAKGLEWKVVFIIWLVEGLFPSGRALEEDPLAQEERRLFYVAVTRAEDNLIMLAPKSRRQRDGGTQFYTPSRFIGELGENVYREVTGYF